MKNLLSAGEFALLLVVVIAFATVARVSTTLDSELERDVLQPTVPAVPSVEASTTRLADVAVASPRAPLQPTAVEPIALEHKCVDVDLVELREKNTRLRSELAGARSEIRRLQLDLGMSDVAAALDTTLGAWVATLLPDEKPSDELVRLVGETVAPYEGVRLSPDEGLWIAERISSKDWRQFGATADDALIAFLGPQRIAREVGPDQLEQLREEWFDEGWFR